MTWPNDDSDIEFEAREPEGKRWAPLIVGVVVLAIVGSGSAFAWRFYGGTPYPTFGFESNSASTQLQTVGLDEFRAFQQKIAEQMQLNTQALADRQADVKRLSEQVAAASAKMDAFQFAISSARTAIAAAAPVLPKKPKPKPSARVSTGGAPLPPVEPSQ